MAPGIGSLDDENIGLRADRGVNRLTHAADLQPDFRGWAGVPRALDPGFERGGRRWGKEPDCAGPVLRDEGERGR